jgi:hypothetical protein
MELTWHFIFISGILKHSPITKIPVLNKAHWELGILIYEIITMIIKGAYCASHNFSMN